MEAIATGAIVLMGCPDPGVAQGEPLGFQDYCERQAGVSVDEQRTIMALLAIADTQTCTEAAATLATLAQLNLGGQELTDLRPLASLTQLKTLYLHDNQITDLRPLATLTNLEVLLLDQNQIHDLRPLAALTQLRKLSVISNQIRDVSPLASLGNLKELSLFDNEIRQISPLATLSALTHLSVSDNRLRTADPIAALPNLMAVDLSQNAIEQVDALRSLTQLTSLDLRNNPITFNVCPVKPATICLFTDVAADLYRRGEQEAQQGEFQTALATFQQALQRYEAQQDFLRASDALAQIGQQYDALGQYANALGVYEQALALRQDLSDRQGEGESAADLGITALRLGQIESAIAQLTLAQDIAQTLAVQERSWLRPGPRQGVILSHLALAYGLQTDHVQSLRAAKQALAVYRYGRDRAGEIRALNQVGNAYRALGELDKAQHYLDRALERSQRLSDLPGVAQTFKSLGDLAFARHNPELAIAHYQQARQLHRQSRDRAGEGEVLTALGTVWLSQAQYSQAETALTTAVQRWEALRPGLEDSNKISLADTQAQTYRLLQQTLIAQGQTEAALAISERGRARAFVELLAHRLKLRGQRQPLNSFTAPTVAEIRQLAQTAQVTFVEYTFVGEQLYIWVVQPTGEIHHRTVDLISPNHDGLSTLALEPNQAAPFYRGQPAATEMAAGVAALRTGIVTEFTEPPPAPQNHQTVQEQQLRQLYNVLIEPIAPLLPRDPNAPVVIIPQNSLFLVPFAALRDAQGDDLIDHHTLMVSPSIQVFQLTQQPSLRPPSGGEIERALIVGNPIMPSVWEPTGNGQFLPVTLPPLAGSETEAAAIAQLLQKSALIGAQATEARVKQELADAQIIHFATHGLLQYGDPQADRQPDVPGAIALTPGQNEDGLLTTAELFSFDLVAELAVLSACDTGRGNITSDGVVGLSRALMTAGVSSVLVSLWAIPDRETATLMQEFYRQLTKGQSKAQALRQAMLMARSQSSNPDPSQWAAFVLMGDGSTLGSREISPQLSSHTGP